MITAFILAALVAIICIVASKVSQRFGVSALLIFIFIGMAFGSEGIVGLNFSDYQLTELLCTIGLIVIMFYGGFGTSWKYAKKYATQAGILSSLGTIFTALLVTVAAHFLLGFEFAESFLLGAVISSTDAASVFSILRSHKLNLKDGLAPLLEVESGSNDPFAYMLMIIGITLLSAQVQASQVAGLVASQIIFGVLFGVLVALVTMFLFKHINFGSNGLDSIFILAVAFLAYALPSVVNGNGFLSVYIAGIIIGNSLIANKIELVHFFDGLTQLAQILIFFLFGLLVFPSRLPYTFIPALITFLVMTFIARPLIMTVLLKPFKRNFKEIAFVSAAGLRGAASLVFAVTAISTLSQEGSPISFDLYHTVFWIVLFSIALQGSIIPYAAKFLKLVDDSESVMKTFNDYQEETDFNLIEMEVEEDGPYAGKYLKDVRLPGGALAVVIKRGDTSVIPQGSTLLKAGDTLVLNAQVKLTSAESIELKELELVNKHPWINHTISDLDLLPHALIVYVKRNDETFIPDGNTRLYNGDTLVLSGEIPQNPQSVLR